MQTIKWMSLIVGSLVVSGCNATQLERSSGDTLVYGFIATRTYEVRPAANLECERRGYKFAKLIAVETSFTWSRDRLATFRCTNSGF